MPQAQAATKLIEVLSLLTETHQKNREIEWKTVRNKKGPNSAE